MMVPRHEAFHEMFHEKFERTFINDDREKDSRGIDNAESKANGCCCDGSTTLFVPFRREHFYLPLTLVNGSM